MPASIFPADIWLIIFEQLCPHCGSEDMPEFNPPIQNQKDSDYETGKSALAALSLTSRYMRHLSQPILYHCFHDHPYRNNMSKFLRTLLSQPQLAHCIRVLSLPQNRLDGDLCEQNTREQLEEWVEASRPRGVTPPRWVPGLLSGDAPGDIVAFDGGAKSSRLQYRSEFPRQYRDPFRSWQQTLTVSLCSAGLTHLAMYDPSLSLDDLWGYKTGPSQAPGPFNFPYLRVFSCSTPVYLEHYSAFISQAPLLNHAAMGHIIDRAAPPKFPNNLRRLSFACWAEAFRDIMGACEGVHDLENLEIYLECRAFDFEGGPEPISWPGSIKRQVRRLCWSLNSWEGWKFIRGEGKNLNFFPPIREFEKLEILEVDRVSLFDHARQGLGPHAPTHDEIVRQVPNVLPASIRILHLSSESCLHHVGLSSWSTIIIELEALAAAKKTTLRSLAVVQLDIWRYEKRPNALPDFLERVGIFSAMRNVGIELLFRQELLINGSPERGMLPELPGNLYYFYGMYKDQWLKSPRRNFALED